MSKSPPSNACMGRDGNFSLLVFKPCSLWPVTKPPAAGPREDNRKMGSVRPRFQAPQPASRPNLTRTIYHSQTQKARFCPKTRAGCLPVSVSRQARFRASSDIPHKRYAVPAPCEAWLVFPGSRLHKKTPAAPGWAPGLHLRASDVDIGGLHRCNDFVVLFLQLPYTGTHQLAVPQGDPVSSDVALVCWFSFFSSASTLPSAHCSPRQRIGINSSYRSP